MVKKGEVSVCLYRRKRRRSPFAFIVEKGEVLRCLLRQEKERCPFAFIVEKGEVSVCLYRRKRSCRVALPFTPRKGVVVSRCLLRQEKESSCRVLDILPKKKNTQKASENTRSRNEKVKSFSTQPFIVSWPDVLPEKKNVQVVSVTIRNRDEMYSQPNPYPNNSDLMQSDVQGSRAAAFYRDQHTRGKCFYLTINCNFDTNSCAAQFTSKWGQTVDVRFLHPEIIRG